MICLLFRTGEASAKQRALPQPTDAFPIYRVILPSSSQPFQQSNSARQVDEERFTQEARFRDGQRAFVRIGPEAVIIGVWAVVPQHEVFPGAELERGAYGMAAHFGVV